LKEKYLTEEEIKGSTYLTDIIYDSIKEEVSKGSLKITEEGLNNLVEKIKPHLNRKQENKMLADFYNV
jgi:hypothetical protein